MLPQGKFEYICFEMTCGGYFFIVTDLYDQLAQCNAMQLIHWNFEK